MLYHTDGDQTAGKTVIPWLFHAHNYSLQQHLSSFFFMCATKPYFLFLPAKGIFPYNVVCSMYNVHGTYVIHVKIWMEFSASLYFATMLRNAFAQSSHDPYGYAVPIFTIRLAIVFLHWLCLPTYFLGLYRQDRRLFLPLIVADVRNRCHFICLSDSPSALCTHYVVKDVSMND